MVGKIDTASALPRLLVFVVVLAIVPWYAVEVESAKPSILDTGPFVQEPRSDPRTPRPLVREAVSPWWSPDGDKIIFNKWDSILGDDYPEIWTVESTGNNPQLIIDNPEAGYHPMWLPGNMNQHIVYYVGGEFVLYNLLTSSVDHVYAVPFLWDDPGFSLTPAVAGIMYTAYQAPGPYELWTLDLGDESMSYVRDGWGGAISPDGDWIAFSTEESRLAIAPMDGGPEMLYGEGGFPSWTPDGEYIVFAGLVAERLDLFVMHRQGAFKQLTDDADLDWFPRVSPDGRWVAWQKSEGEFGPHSIWTLDLSSVIPTPSQKDGSHETFARNAGDLHGDVPAVCRLVGANPGNPSSAFEFNLEEPAAVRLEIYDVRGRLIQRVVSGDKPAGSHFALWEGVDENGRPVSSGVYFYRFESGPNYTTGKITVVR